MNKVNLNNLIFLVCLFLYCRFFYVFIIIFFFCDVVVVIEMFFLMWGDIFFEVKYVVFIVMEILDEEDRVSFFILFIFEKVIIRGLKFEVCGF